MAQDDACGVPRRTRSPARHRGRAAAGVGCVGGPLQHRTAAPGARDAATDRAVPARCRACAWRPSWNPAPSRPPPSGGRGAGATDRAAARGAAVGRPARSDLLRRVSLPGADRAGRGAGGGRRRGASGADLPPRRAGRRARATPQTRHRPAARRSGCGRAAAGRGGPPTGWL